ncbi:DHA1 family inner membrane transport protein [Actinoalloteichus hoggarensis]|uniref:Inner membrane transport protein YdhP n=1 Tax=Actinoalloteichus hoggarensis TaxID=1470176 RepID=A0A221WAZ1_9PSEU|nr:MFS transporter [Actinoalloteichus hoggarensis]ASO23152.1 Inner membrane transport protein YdhP [Actinoalloteichus hoggarensis]MBB5922756.1 DHA1 family inner membrane transport protein [Actinoalloteichus hoggarensis]
MLGSHTTGAGGAVSLSVLTAGVFVIGTAEYVVVGLLPQLSDDLDVSVPTAGMLVTWYALTVTVGGPLVTVATLRLPRRLLLPLAALVFALGNLVAATADTYRLLVVARTVTALTHSTFFAVALVTAVALVPAGRRGLAVAVVSSGFNLATVLGAPAGTWLGAGHGWRATFWAIAILGVAVAIVLPFAVRGAAASPSGLRGEVRALLDARVATLLLITVFTQAGLFTLYTYIAPLLTEVSGFDARAIASLLLLFGAGALVGNLLGGSLADHSPWNSLLLLTGALAATSAAFLVTATSRPAVTVALVLLGTAAFALVPVLQTRVAALAAAAPTLAVATNTSGFNLGIAAGSWLGARQLDAGSSLISLSVTASTLVLVGFALAVLLVYRLRARPAETTTGPSGGRRPSPPRRSRRPSLP